MNDSADADRGTTRLTGASDDERSAAEQACADEPIRVPGSIQPHGVLLAVDASTFEVLITSRGASDLVGPGAQPGADLAAHLPELAELVRSVSADTDLVSAATPATLTGTHPLDVLAHRVDDLVIVEAEPATGDEQPWAGAPWQVRLPAALRRLQDATSPLRLSEELAVAVRALTGFDRVMVYRFDEEWNGEVIAEQRRDDLEPFLGLHYPASDIPAQARELYEKQWLRIIPDIRYSPVPLEPSTNPATGEPLDLSFAALRSVSPVHLRYLAHMGVASSMSISLLSGGRLWGLVACHHYAGPHRPSQPVRGAAEFLGRTASLLLPTVIGLDAYADVLACARVRSRLTEALAEHPGQPVDALTRGQLTIADLVPCSGAALRLHSEMRLVGQTPSAADVTELLSRLRTQPLVTSRLSADVPDLARLSDVASGVLASPIEGGTIGDGVVWFRPEVLREVTWGGDPRASEVIIDKAGDLRLHPRHSFEAWKETVRERSTRWLSHEVEAATEFAAHLSSSMLREVERTNRLATALQQTLLMEKLPDVPGLDLAARYSPHSDDVVGGDWYDVVVLPSGRRAAVLGDVAGHGLAVSAISAQMRNALRAYVLSTEEPGLALARLNDLVASLLPGELATAVVVVLDPTTGEAATASAGHPPLVHLRAAGPTALEGSRGPALGLVAGAEYESTLFTLERGEALLLYSDGLVESRDASFDDRLAMLLAELAGRTDDLEELCDRLVSRLSAHADDTTVLAVRRA